MSLACTRRMYSPGEVNVAVVTVLPSAALSIAGFALAKVMSAGPRCRLHDNARSGLAPRPRAFPPPPAGGRATFAENFAGLSVTQTVRGNGSDTVAVSDATTPPGGPVCTGPPGSTRSIGGVLP